MLNSFQAFLLAAYLVIGEASVEVEIANTPELRNRGLMDRESLEEGAGMLFVYDRPQELTFWMKNTRIPLSIGFFNANQTLINILEMKPANQQTNPLPLYQSAKPAQYALEVPQGWFKKNKIKPGMKFSIENP